MVHYWRKGYFIPLWVLLEFISLFPNSNILLNKMERKVIAYKGRSDKSIIPYRNNKFLLPLKVTPEFVSVYFHLIFDGCVTKKSTASYYQVNEIARKNFLEKLENCFGEFKIFKKSNKNYYTVQIPFPIVQIIQKYFNVKSFKSKESEIPFKIMKLKRAHKVAGISALIVDEGSINDSTHVGLSNYKLLNQIKKLVKSLGYKSGKVKKYKEFWAFSFSNKSLDIMKNDIDKLSILFPTCNLAHKQPLFQILYNIHTRGTDNTIYNWQKIEFVLKEILSRKKQCSTSQLQNTLNILYDIYISRTALRRYLKRMCTNNLLRLIKVDGEKGCVWSLL